MGINLEHKISDQSKVKDAFVIRLLRNTGGYVNTEIAAVTQRVRERGATYPQHPPKMANTFNRDMRV